MASQKKRSDFFGSEEGEDIQAILKKMVADTTYNTESTYSSNGEQYPDNLIPFVDKHMNYLNSHPKLDSSKYIRNLRLMTRIR